MFFTDAHRVLPAGSSRRPAHPVGDLICGPACQTKTHGDAYGPALDWEIRSTDFDNGQVACQELSMIQRLNAAG